MATWEDSTIGPGKSCEGTVGSPGCWAVVAGLEFVVPGVVAVEVVVAVPEAPQPTSNARAAVAARVRTGTSEIFMVSRRYTQVTGLHGVFEKLKRVVAVG